MRLWTRRFLGGLTLATYVAALAGSAVLHGPHGGATCCEGDCAAASRPADQGRSAGHPHSESCHHRHVHTPRDAAPEHEPQCPPPRHDPDTCGWCQFLALSAWTGPAVAVVSPPVPLIEATPQFNSRVEAFHTTRPPIRGPPVSPGAV